MTRRFQFSTILAAIMAVEFSVLGVDGYFGFPITFWLFGDAILFVQQRVLSPMGL